MFKEKTDEILPNLDELHKSIRHIAFDINARMITLQTHVESTSKTEQVQTLTNLRNCVQSAASVISSASTTLSIEHADHFSVTCGSEFGDCFPSQPNETVLRWVSSNTVYEFEDMQQANSVPSQRASSKKNARRASDTSESDYSDSDNDLEAEIIQALLKRGQKRLDVEDFSGAERVFQNCLTRIVSSLSLSSAHRASKAEVITLLVKTYQQQQKWNAAQSILIEKIASASRNTDDDDSDVLSDILTLVEVLLKKEAYSEALLYGRRALKGYRRMGKSGADGVGRTLRILVDVCHAEGNVDEEEAYNAVLSDFTDNQASKPREEPRPPAEEGYITPDHDVTKRALSAPQPGQILIAIREYTFWRSDKPEHVVWRICFSISDPRLASLTFSNLDDFSARSSDELSLSKGDRVELIERDDDFGDGWYLGRHLTNGTAGLFPESR